MTVHDVLGQPVRQNPFCGDARVVAVSNITLSGLQTIDSVVLITHDRVLLTGQTNAANNGMYLASTGGWSRARDLSISDDFKGVYIYVEEGTVYRNTTWYFHPTTDIVVGTTPITFLTGPSGLALEDNVLTTSKYVDKSVTLAKMADLAGPAVLGRAAGTTGVMAGITLSADGQVLQRSGGAISGATLVNANINAAAAIDTNKLSYLGTNGVARSLQTKLRETVNVKDHGAMGDGIYITGNCSIASGLNVLTVSTAAFTIGDVGKRIVVPGAGAASAILTTTISGYNNGTQVTLTANAGTTLSAASKTVLYGTDDATFIALAIAALPATGGDVLFPAGVYVVTTSINVGNGSSSAVSTRYGVHLIGVGHGPYSGGMVTGYPDGGTSRISAAAAIASSGVINIKGPLQGWGVQNLNIDGQLLADIGLNVKSGQFGDSRNVSVSNCRVQAIGIDVVAATVSGASTANAMHNHFSGKTVVWIPDVANAAGLVFNGNATSNACFNIVESLLLVNGGNGVAGFGLFFGCCDSNIVGAVHAFNGGALLAVCTFDYSVSNIFPSGNQILWIDPGNYSVQWQNGGAPGASARPNKVIDLFEGNGGARPQGPLANFVIENVYGQDVQLAQSANVGATTLVTPAVTGLYKVNYYLFTMTASGTGTVNVGIAYTDEGNNVQTQTSGNINLGSLTSFVQGAFVVNAKAAVAVQYTTTTGGTVGAGRYGIRVSVERM